MKIYINYTIKILLQTKQRDLVNVNTENFPDIVLANIEKALKTMTNGRSSPGGEYQIIIEAIKHKGSKL